LVRLAGKKPHIEDIRRRRHKVRRVVLSGNHVARWLAKTFCNVSYLNRQVIPHDFCRFAFGAPPNSRLYCYAHMFKNQRLRPVSGHITAGDFLDAAGNCIWFVRLADVVWLLTNHDLHSLGLHIQLAHELVDTKQFMLQPKRLAIQHKLDGRTLTSVLLEFDWTG
jgi:hypothetical protein